MIGLNHLHQLIELYYQLDRVHRRDHQVLFRISSLQSLFNCQHNLINLILVQLGDEQLETVDPFTHVKFRVFERINY